MVDQEGIVGAFHGKLRLNWIHWCPSDLSDLPCLSTGFTGCFGEVVNECVGSCE